MSEQQTPDWGGWTPEQFWEYVEGLTDAYTRDCMRDMLASRGLSFTSRISKVEPSTGALVSVCLDRAYCKYPACDCHTVAPQKPTSDVIAALAVFLAFFENRPASVITVSAEAFERARDAVIEECAGVADAYSNEYRGAASDAGDDIANRIHSLASGARP